MTKAELLESYNDINLAYNRPSALEDLESRIDSMILDWLNSFDTTSATKCFEAVNLLKQRLEGEDK